MSKNFFQKNVSYIKNEERVRITISFSLFHEAMVSPIERLDHPNYSLEGDLVYISINHRGEVAFGEIIEKMFYPILINISMFNLGQAAGEYSPSEMKTKLQKEEKKLIIFEKREKGIYYPKYLFE